MRTKDTLTMPVGKLCGIPTDKLAEILTKSTAEIKRLQTLKKGVESIIANRHSQELKDLRAMSGKGPWGTVTLAPMAYKGLRIKETIQKKVVWDQEELEFLWRNMEEEVVTAIFNVSEKTFSSLPEDQKRVFEVARTVKPGTTKIEIIVEGQK